MSTLRQRILLAIAAFLVFTAMIGAIVWRTAYVAALDPLAVQAQADLSLASDRLTGQLQRFRELSVLMADHPAVRARLEGSAPNGVDVAGTAGALLLSVADKTGMVNIILLDRQGRVQAAADPQLAAMTDHAVKPYFKRAISGALGNYHQLSPRDDLRVFSYAAPVYQKNGPPLGVVVVVADIESTEADWRGDASAVFFTDPLGVVFLASRSELVLRGPRAEFTGKSNVAEYNPEKLLPFPPYSVETLGGHEIWNLRAGRYLPDVGLHLTKELPVAGLTGEVLVNTRPAQRLAWLQALLASGVCLLFGMFLLVYLARRRRMHMRLAQNARAKEQLEVRVAERTAALSQTNTQLRREIADRLQAEEELRKTQGQLVQAGKLSALGQMSAGISHELNQPLMAIQTYAENTALLIEKERFETVRANVGTISELAFRMGRIVKNLRAFARQEDAPLGSVDPVAVVDTVLEMSAHQSSDAGVQLDWKPPDASFRVRAGEVRLQQVLLNLVSNAIDAMRGSEVRNLTIRITPDGAEGLQIQVRDTGPGIKEPDRIFDPFYTTKEISQEDGMGLGLSISYGLVQSFGGDIEGRNHSEGGAEFVVHLPLIQSRVAA